MSGNRAAEGSIPGVSDELVKDASPKAPRVSFRRPCDRWFMKLRDGSSGLDGSAAWTKEMLDAVRDEQADNPEARVVLSELRQKFSIAGAAFPTPVLGENIDFYYGDAAVEFISEGNALYLEKDDLEKDDLEKDDLEKDNLEKDNLEKDANIFANLGPSRISRNGSDVGKNHELIMAACDAKDVPLAALRSGFYSGIDDNRDWIKRAFEDLKTGKVSLEALRAALRDGCLNAVGRYYDGAGTMNADAVKHMDKLRIDIDYGKEVRMHTKRGWPFGIKVPASSVELPNPAFNLDTIGSKIPGIRGAK